MKKTGISKVFMVALLSLALISQIIGIQSISAEETISDVEICEKIGMLQGEEEGVTKEYLEKKTTRLQAAIMSLRLRGLEEEALAFDGTANFQDVNQVSWKEGRNLMSYLYANPHLGWVGYYDGTLKPNDIISAQAFYKVMLEALGFFENEDYTWDEVFDYAESKGLTKLRDQAEMTNEDIATATVEVLNATNAYGKQHAEYLVELGVIPLQLAVELDLIDIDENAGLIRIYSDDANHRITADGKSSTQLTVQLEKIDGTLIAVDGVLNIEVSLGSISSNEIILENGSASFQLTSAELIEMKTSYVQVTLDKTLSTDYAGVTGQISIEFDPKEVEDFVSSYMGIDRITMHSCDRFEVDFAEDITVQDYIDALYVYEGFLSWKEILENGTTAGFYIDGQPVSVVGIEQFDDDVLTFVLDTDNAGSYSPEYNVEIERITDGWSGLSKHYLNDNEDHVVTIPKNVGNLLLASLDGYELKASDTIRPYVKRIYNRGSREIYIELSEAVSEEIVEPIIRGEEFLSSATDFTTNMAGHYGLVTIGNYELYLTYSPNNASQAERDFAEKEKVLLVNNVEVGSYNSVEYGRNTVKITLDKSSALKEGSYSFTAKWFRDWAGVVDDNNIIADYMSTLSVEYDSDAPTVQIEVQSPEQWLIKFSEPVKFINSINEAINLTYGPDKIELREDINGNYAYNADEYTVTDVTAYYEGDETKLLVEFYKDWTEYFDTASTGMNYTSLNVLPFVMTFEDEEIWDLEGNYMKEAAVNIDMLYDGFSPIVVQAVDASTEDLSIEPGEEIIIRVNEPVQIEDWTGAPSTVRMTPSQSQTYLKSGLQFEASNVPQPTFEFIKGDMTVGGRIKAASIHPNDMEFRIEPDAVLSPGDWVLYIRNLTDDIGNAISTKAIDFEVPIDYSSISNPVVAWVGFDNTNKTAAQKQYDYVYIKFNTVMNHSGASGVSRIDNYYINGELLPEGTLVFAGIPNVTNDWDGVTLQIPANHLYDSDISEELDISFNLRLANNLTSSYGYRMNNMEYLISDFTGLSENGKDMKFEAAYFNYNSTTLINGEAVIGAYAIDGAGSGNMDQVHLTLANATPMSGSETIYVNGQEFKIATTNNSYTHIFIPKKSGNQLVGTNPKDYQILSSSGEVMIGTGKIEDRSGPAILEIVHDSSTKITVYFSEEVKDSTVILTDFVLGGTGIAGEFISSISTGQVEDDHIFELYLNTNPMLNNNETITIKLANVGVIEERFGIYTSAQTSEVTFIK